MSQEIRWQFRFNNFSRAYSLLREALEDGVEPLSQLELEGVIQRFEFTFELSWNLLKDRLEYDGVVIATVTPRNVIREAYSAKLIDDCEVWIDMLTDRNLMSHTYDFDKFRAVVENVHSRYLTVLNDIYQRLAVEIQEK
ncbi:MAG: nucleotidyltransferase [Chloroflexi bacterium]|nr:nucleotidyltransferase [Chloroflexota bacterium]